MLDQHFWSTKHCMLVLGTGFWYLRRRFCYSSSRGVALQLPISVCLMCERGFHISGFVQRTRKAVSDEQTGDSTRSAKKAKKLEVRACVCVSVCARAHKGGRGIQRFVSMHLAY